MKFFRIKIHFAVFLLLLSMLCGNMLAAEPIASGQPLAMAADDDYTVAAKAAILVERSTGEVIFAQNADEQVYPASLTKIMTCLLTLENGNLTDTVTVSESAMKGLDAAGSTAGLQVGEQISVENLLYCMMISSANEACNIAAEYVAGSIDAFVDLMNQRAQELGCTGTHFANPHGLHDDNHYTTARDLAKIAAAALDNRTFYNICTTTDYTVPATNLSGPRQLHTTNYLVSDSVTSDYFYARAKGVKTGYTSKAGRCLITTATDGNLSLLSVLCGADTKVMDSGDLVLESFPETKKLCEYAFDHFDFATVLDAKTPAAQIPVAVAKDAESVVVSPTDSITKILPVDYDESLLKTEVHLNNPDGVDAPISAGQILGTITVTYAGAELGTVSLAAITDVERSEFLYYNRAVQNFFHNYRALWIILIVLLFVFLFILRYILINRARRRRAAQRRRRSK